MAKNFYVYLLKKAAKKIGRKLLEILALVAVLFALSALLYLIGHNLEGAVSFFLYSLVVSLIVMIAKDSILK